MALSVKELAELLCELRADGLGGRFIDRAADLYKRFLKAHNRSDERGVLIPLIATISTSTSNYTATDVFDVPSNEALFITEIQGVVALRDPDGETLAIAGIGNPSLLDRIALKAMNCRVTLKDTDEPRDVMTDGDTLPLNTLLGCAGGQAFHFPANAPDMVPPGHNLKMTATLIDQAAAIVGGSTDYGLILIGKQVRLGEGV